MLYYKDIEKIEIAKIEWTKTATPYSYNVQGEKRYGKSYDFKVLGYEIIFHGKDYRLQYDFGSREYWVHIEEKKKGLFKKKTLYYEFTLNTVKFEGYHSRIVIKCDDYDDLLKCKELVLGTLKKIDEKFD